MKKIIVLLLSFLLVVTSTYAAERAVAWDPNSEDNLAGYKLYYADDPDTFTGQNFTGTTLIKDAVTVSSPIDIPLSSLSDITNPVYDFTTEDTNTYIFALTAYNEDGMESDFSDTVSIGAIVLLAFGNPVGVSVEDTDGTPEEIVLYTGFTGRIINFTWSAVPDAVSYDVGLYHTQEERFVITANTPTPDIALTIPKIGIYEVWIKAIGDGIESEWSKTSDAIIMKDTKASKFSGWVAPASDLIIN